MPGCYVKDSLSFIHLCDVWSYTQDMSKNTHLQVMLFWKKCRSAFPSHYTPAADL